MRPNWFIAFPVDAAFVQDLPPPPSAVRRFHPDDVHLTLAFLGGCSEQAAREAWALLETRLTRERRAFTVSLAGVVGMGGSRRGYTALSALLERGREEAAGWLTSLEEPLLQAVGRPASQRLPKPHITLARPLRRATSAQRAAALGWAQSLDLRGVRLRLDRLALYTWSDQRPKRLFKIVEQHPLPE